MCFSADVSVGTALALLPAGAYCLEAAWRKDRAYLPLATVPVLFGVQQLCEGRVWAALDAGHLDLARGPSLAFLFFAFVVWPVGIPAAVAAVESGTRSRVFLAVAGVGAVVAAGYYLPIAADGGRGLNPAAVGHSIRYDLSAVPAANGWFWLTLYLVTVSGPLLASRNGRLRPMGAAVMAAAAVSYVLFEYAFASVWCFFAAVLSLYLSYVFYRLPGPSGLRAGTGASSGAR
ncbi:MAG TPA: DUF6629 family protein [Gemmataceae bacterium]|jgi:hypothetical protein|nr:DUF6629 family protein [Gemmataceae bacterium]